MTATKDLSKHPCFNRDAAGTCGRVHLPVAPKCNIMCNFCNRKYDCVSESRPGVTSAVLSPEQAVAYMDKVLEKEPRITVCGIAGPGDPLANPETMRTIRLLKEKYPQMLFCLSTNGLALPAHAAELAELGVSPRDGHDHGRGPENRLPHLCLGPGRKSHPPGRGRGQASFGAPDRRHQDP
jgi:nitrogen fixation protein NifB